MGWCIDYMKFFLSIILLIMLSSCAAKTSENCLSSSLSIWAENKNINITLNDNGCRYNIHKMPKNIWKIEVENGSFSSFTPKAEKEVKSMVPVIKKNNKEVLLFFAANGRLIQNGKSSFIYMQDNLSYMPERKAGYIENIICGDDNIIKSNGAVSYKISSLSFSSFVFTCELSTLLTTSCLFLYPNTLCILLTIVEYETLCCGFLLL